MIFSILVIVMVLGVTYMHFLQGAFTSVISFGCALVATLVAFGYYENVVNMTGQGGMSDYAGGASLLILFTLTYGVLRVIADSVVPGNIGLQLYVEKVFSVIFGFGAAVLAGGTFAIAVQMMPLGPTVGGYARYDVQDRDVVVPVALTGRQRGSDTSVGSELIKTTFDGQANGLLLPVDNLVLSLVKTTSTGALSGSQSFAAIHPDLPTETFGTRLGAEGSGKHAVLNTAKGENAKLGGLFTLKSPPKGLDTEAVELRPQKASLIYKPGANEVVTVVRVTFEPAAADRDGYVRLTPSAARLVIGENTFYPVGTMETASLVGLSRLDDELFVPVSAGTNSIDLAYVLPKGVADSLAKPAGNDTVRFVEVKLFGRIDLGSTTTEPYKTDKTVKVSRKKESPLGKELHPPQA